MHDFEGRKRVKSFWQKAINYFLRGLLVLLPFAITIGIVVWLVNAIGSVIIKQELSGKEFVFYAVGIIIFILATGYFTKGVVARQILDFVEGVIEKAPGFKFIFGTTKDMTEAFVGDKKKFTEAVIVEVNPGVYKMGFITQKNMEVIGRSDLMAVYLPFCYAISGEMLLVSGDKVTKIDQDGSHVTKFIISGGVVNLDREVITKT